MAAKLTPFTKLLVDSFQVFFRYLYQFFLITLVVYVPLSVVYLLLFGQIDAASLQTISKDNPALFVKIWGTGGVYWVVALLILSFYQIALITKIMAGDKGEDKPIKVCYQEAVKLFGGNLLVSVLVSVKVILWSLVLIIPGVIFSLLYSFSNIAFIADGHKGNGALKYSKVIIKASFGKYVLYLLGMSLLFLVPYFLCQFIVALLFGTGSPTATGIMPHVGTVLLNFANQIFGIYGFIFMYKLYRDLQKNTSETA